MGKIIHKHICWNKTQRFIKRPNIQVHYQRTNFGGIMKNTTHGFDPENVEYLKRFLGKEAVKLFEHYSRTQEVPTSKRKAKTVLKVLRRLCFMQSFGDNHWWESDDDRIVAFFQIQETTLLVDPKRLLSGLSKLTNQPITQRNIGLNLAELQRFISENHHTSSNTQ